MKLKRLRPGKQLLLLLLALGIGGFGAGLLGAGTSETVGLGGVLLALLLVATTLDYLQGRRAPALRLERQMPQSLAVNRWSPVRLVVRHSYSSARAIELYDGLPSNAEAQGLPFSSQLLPGQSTEVRYRLRVNERGPAQFLPCEVRLASPWRLWQASFSIGEAVEIKVYPDFAAIKAFSILAQDNRTSQLGIKKKPRRGEGMEFHQLREYRRGDSVRQVDWKATSRKRKLISREYQDERDQQVILMVDSGRRMRTKDGALSHFDHALNALLLVGYVALRQGDSVGVMSFGSADRWLPPQKGAGRITAILNRLYDLKVGNHASDYLEAAKTLIQRQRKRSLVILMTNTRDEEVDELNKAIRLLQKRHLVLLANMREVELDQVMANPVQNFEQALAYAGVGDYLRHRKQAQDQLLAGGLLAVDCNPQQLPGRMASSYLEIKASGAL